MIYLILKYHLYSDGYVPYLYAKTKEQATEWIRTKVQEDEGDYIIEEVNRCVQTS